MEPTADFLLINTATRPGFFVWNRQITVLPDQHLEDLLPMLEISLGGARPDAIGLVTGPGSFTSIRIGFSVARALSLGWGVPLHGVSLYEWLRPRIPHLAVEMRRGRWLVEAHGGLLLIDEHALLQRRALGENWTPLRPEELPSREYVDLLEKTCRQFAERGTIAAEPLYGIPPNITLPTVGR